MLVMSESMSASVGFALSLRSAHRHDHAGLAIAALRHVVIEPGLLHLVKDPVLGEAFDRGDLLAFSFADRQRARAHCLTIDVNRACAALRDAAAIFGAGKADLFP